MFARGHLVHDQFAHGGSLRILNVVDDVTRECLAAIADTSISDKRGARELTAIITRQGKPTVIASHHGTEFTSNAILTWAEKHRIDGHYIVPGQADAEQLHRVIQWPHARRVAETRRCSSISAMPAQLSERGLPTTTLHRNTHLSM
jgi:hypothetical protein